MIVFSKYENFLCRCGKTTICQFLAQLLQNKLFSINCHMHTEATDFLGGLRPVRKQSEEVGTCLSTYVHSMCSGGSRGSL